MSEIKQRARKSMTDDWKTWNSVTAEARRVNRQVSRDLRQIATRTEKLIALITD